MRDNDSAAPPRGSAVQIQFMGRPSDIFGAACELVLAPEGATLGDIRARLAESLADGAGAALLNPAIRGGIEDEVQPDSARVRPGQTVFSSPVCSGG